MLRIQWDNNNGFVATATNFLCNELCIQLQYICFAVKFNRRYIYIRAMVISACFAGPPISAGGVPNDVICGFKALYFNIDLHDIRLELYR